MEIHHHSFWWLGWPKSHSLCSMTYFSHQDILLLWQPRGVRVHCTLMHNLALCLKLVYLGITMHYKHLSLLIGAMPSMGSHNMIPLTVRLLQKYEYKNAKISFLYPEKMQHFIMMVNQDKLCVIQICRRMISVVTIIQSWCNKWSLNIQTFHHTEAWEGQVSGFISCEREFFEVGGRPGEWFDFGYSISCFQKILILEFWNSFNHHLFYVGGISCLFVVTHMYLHSFVRSLRKGPLDDLW